MNHRRSFLKKLAAGFAAIGLLPVAKKSLGGEIKPAGGLMHHVFFWLKEPGNPESRRQFEKGLDKLLKVETIRFSHVGVPATTEKRDVVDNSFTYSYMVMFDNQEGHDIYQTHPLHLKFVEENSHLWEKVIVYDAVN